MNSKQCRAGIEKYAQATDKVNRLKAAAMTTQGYRDSRQSQAALNAQDLMGKVRDVETKCASAEAEAERARKGLGE